MYEERNEWINIRYLKLIKETALKHVNILSFFQVIWKIVP